MRLLIFHLTIAPYRIDFFNNLSAAFETRVCLHYHNLRSQKFDYDKILAQLQFTPIYLKQVFTLRERTICSGYWHHLNEFHPDVVIVGEFGVNTIATLLHRFITRKKYKVVSICDDSYNMVAEQNDFSYVHHLLRKIITPFLDDLILVEPTVTAWYQQHYGKGFFFPIIKDDDNAREEYQKLLPLSRVASVKFGLTEKCVFLFVGRLVALKNVKTLLYAYAQVKSDKTALVIIGDGAEAEYLKVLDEQLQTSAIFTGRLEGNDLLLWYNIGKCLILPSYQEPFGAVTNEALLAGCKGIISKKAGSQCLIDEGLNGYTFNPMNVDELAEKMKLISNESVQTSYESLRPSMMLYRYDSKIRELVNHLSLM